MLKFAKRTENCVFLDRLRPAFIPYLGILLNIDSLVSIRAGEFGKNRGYLSGRQEKRINKKENHFKMILFKFCAIY